MNTRLVWNFEITNRNLLNREDFNEARDELRWEARYFWPGDAIISLDGLDNHFVQLSNYVVKQRKDSYLLFENYNFNLKRRQEQLFYKPLLQENNELRGFGKKINLAEYSAEAILPGTNNLKAADLAMHQREIEVVKEALVYKFPSKPTIKLELARLQIKKEIYFSLCVEGHSQILVQLLAKQLLNKERPCDYVNFLKQTLHYDD